MRVPAHGLGACRAGAKSDRWRQSLLSATTCSQVHVLLHVQVGAGSRLCPIASTPLEYDLKSRRTSLPTKRFAHNFEDNISDQSIRCRRVFQVFHGPCSRTCSRKFRCYLRIGRDVVATISVQYGHQATRPLLDKLVTEQVLTRKQTRGIELGTEMYIENALIEWYID